MRLGSTPIHAVPPLVYAWYNGWVRVLVDESVPERERQRVEALVRTTLEGQGEPLTMVVSVVKLRGGGWNVFVNNLEDRSLIESLQDALRRELT